MVVVYPYNILHFVVSRHNFERAFYKKRNKKMLPTISLMDFKTPYHLVFFENQIKKFHGELNSRLHHHFTIQNADFCKKLIYAIPTSVIVKILSPTSTVALGLLGGAYLWSCREELISKKTKIDILHSVAIGFFVNLIHLSTEVSAHAFLKVPFDTTLLAASLLAANQIEPHSQESRSGIPLREMDDQKGPQEEISNASCPIAI